VRPPWVTTSQPSPRRRASTESTTNCEPKRAASSEPRPCHRGGVDAGLVGAGRQQLAGIVDGSHAAAHAERHENALGRASHPVEASATGVGRGTDVEEDDLVGPLGGIALGRLRRVAVVGEVGEAHPLDDAAVGHVEARDHPAGELGLHRLGAHERSSPAQAASAAASEKRPSKSALPTITAATPGVARAAT
jgi:hypothetical protein